MRSRLVLPVVLLTGLALQAQTAASYPAGYIPPINMGGGYMPGEVQMDMAQKILEKQRRDAKAREEQQKMVASGLVSALDLQAPSRAVNEYNAAAPLLQQKPKEAIKHLLKAIAEYPNFVSAHNSLGLAYFDLDDAEHSRSEFERAISLDDKFPSAHVNLGRLLLARQEFDPASVQLERAASLKPLDAGILTALSYAQSGAHQYARVLETTRRLHGLNHKGVASAHFVAAAAAIALGDYSSVQRELEFFLQEDPASPLAPSARHNLDILAHNRQPAVPAVNGVPQAGAAASSGAPATFPNSERLRAELAGLGDGSCRDCSPSPEPAATAARAASPAPKAVVRGELASFTLRKDVDEVAVSFVVTSGGRLLNDLEAGDIRIRDDGKPPEKVLQFSPQWKLPLRLGLLVDTSGSVQTRFDFEKQAAVRFVAKILANESDLAFVAGFSNKVEVMQDFSADKDALAAGIQRLSNAGGTALFDAVSLACWKLAAYPQQERVAKVLVVLTDGEDNSSHRSLRRTIEDAETTGVTIFVISTKTDLRVLSDADKVLKAVAERSGGEAVFPGDLLTLDSTFKKLRDMIRSRYLIAYKPADFQADGRYRTISITATKGGKTLTVHARRGYHARFEGNGNSE